MNVLFVPCLGLDTTLLERLANSIDYPIKYKVAFNNGPVGALNEFEAKHPDWRVITPNLGNRGVAGSWNFCPKLFPDEDTYLIVNEDVWFTPGCLEILCKCADKYGKCQPLIMVNETNGFYCFIWTKYGATVHGTFDENFWPAYYEDWDMVTRHKLAGIGYGYALPEYKFGVVVKHGKPRVGGTNYNALIQGTGLLNRAYWFKKWGTVTPPEAVYKNPYKDRRIDPNEWIYYPEHRAKLQILWDTFMGLPKPSIYD